MSIVEEVGFLAGFVQRILTVDPLAPWPVSRLGTSVRFAGI